MKSAEDYYNEAMKLCEDGRCDEALTILDEGLELYPDSQSLLGHKAMLLRIFKRYDEALELHNRLFPDASEFVNRDGLLLDMGLYSDALETFSMAIDYKHKQKGICVIGRTDGNTT